MRALLATLFIACLSGSVFAASDIEDRAKAQVLAAIQSTDIHAVGSKPFRLEARVQITINKPVDGTYKLMWASPHQWREEVQFPDYQQTWVRNADKQWIYRTLGYRPLRVQQLDGLFGSKLPISFDKMEIKGRERRQEQDMELDCAQVVTKDTESKVSSKEEFCVNVRTGMPARRKYASRQSSENLVAESEDYSAFGDKNFPRTLRLLQDGKPLVTAWIDKLEPETPDPSIFSPLPGVDVWPTCDEVKHPEPEHTPDPSYSREARKKGIQGTAVLYVLVGIDGKVAKTGVLQTLEPSLDNQAMNAVRSWRFKPALCGNLPVPAEITVEMKFALFR